jgi:hypothetical protein
MKRPVVRLAVLIGVVVLALGACSSGDKRAGGKATTTTASTLYPAHATPSTKTCIKALHAGAPITAGEWPKFKSMSPVIVSKECADGTQALLAHISTGPGRNRSGACGSGSRQSNSKATMPDC